MFVVPIPAQEEFLMSGRRAPVVWSLVVLNAIVFLFTVARANADVLQLLPGGYSHLRAT